MSSPSVSIAIVNFNASIVLQCCLRSLDEKLNPSDISYEVIVVDNNSQDDSIEMIRARFPAVHLIMNKENIFFSGGVNRALQDARGEFFWILGPDTEILENPLPAMVSCLRSNPNLGAVSGRLYDADGSLHKTCSRDYTLRLALVNYTLLGKLVPSLKVRVNRSYLYEDLSRDCDFEAEVLADSHLLTRTPLLKAIGGYDSTLRLYHVENDLCRRLRSVGSELRHLAVGKVTHIERVSVNHSGLDRIARIYEEDVLRYYKKFYGEIAASFLGILISLSNLLFSIIRRRPQRFLRLFLEPPP